MIHIGTEKTGTSHIQRFLHDNRDLLADQGLRYPTFLGQLNHTKLVVGFTAKQQDIHRHVDFSSRAEHLSQLVEDFDREISAFPAARWVFSTEHLSSRLKSDGEVESFRDWMAQRFEDLEVVVYFRRQDFMAPSAYSTFVRSGGAAPWDLADLLSPYFDLLGLFERWAGVFGPDRILARPYIESMNRGDSLVTDFLTSIGLPRNLGWRNAAGNLNPRLSRAAVETLRIINQQVRDRRAQPVLDRSGLVEELPFVAPGAPWKFPLEMMTEVAEHYRVANEKLVSVVGSYDARWFEWLDQTPDGTTATEGAFGAEDLAAVLLPLAQRRLLTAAEDPRLRTVGAKIDKLRNRAGNWAMRRDSKGRPLRKG